MKTIANATAETARKGDPLARWRFDEWGERRDDDGALNAFVVEQLGMMECAKTVLEAFTVELPPHPEGRHAEWALFGARDLVDGVTANLLDVVERL